MSCTGSSAGVHFATSPDPMIRLIGAPQLRRRRHLLHAYWVRPSSEQQEEVVMSVVPSAHFLDEEVGEHLQNGVPQQAPEKDATCRVLFQGPQAVHTKTAACRKQTEFIIQDKGQCTSFVQVLERGYHQRCTGAGPEGVPLRSKECRQLLTALHLQFLQDREAEHPACHC